MSPQADQSVHSPVHTTEPVAPPSATLMGRLFVVPAILVTLLICLAIVVVLFGGTSVGQRPSISDLLSTIESGGGRHTAGMMLFPADREVWQAAQELATRLARRDAELPADQVEPTAQRIAKILASIKPQGTDDDSVPAKQRFLILAAARLGTPSSAKLVASYLTNADPLLRQAALAGLMEMRESPAARSQLAEVIARLDDESPAVQIVACAAVGVLADPQDATAIRALRNKLVGEREAQWNAALAISRLGSKSAKMVLMNMLDRGFWEKNRVQYQEANDRVDRPFTAREIENYLLVSIDAAGKLDDPELRECIVRLQSDPSVPVREAARLALKSGAPSTATAAIAPGV